MSHRASNPLRQADEVNMFPSLELVAPKAILTPAPSSSSGNRKSGKLKIKTKFPNQSAISTLPGLLKTTKPTIAQGLPTNADDFLAFVGFNATHVYFDGESIEPSSGIYNNNDEDREPRQSIIDLGLQALIDDSPPHTSRTNATSALGDHHSPTKKKETGKRDPVVDELRNYTVLLDKFSLHNFMIYNGQALRDTPEFQSFRRSYNHEWGSIAVIISMLEKLLREHSVKLAIINGPCVYDLASLNLVTIEKDDLILCISNIDQVKPQLKSLFNNESAGGRDETDEVLHRHKAATICQSLIRRFLAGRRVKRIRRWTAAAIIIQSVARMRIYRRVGMDRMKRDKIVCDERWAQNSEKLVKLWRGLHADTSSSSSHTSPSQRRLVIHIPSICAQEYLRIDMDGIRAIQNAHIACLSQLADPDVTVVYVTPCPLGPHEIEYHDKLLSMLGITTLPKRLHFVVPEMLHRLPHHLSLAQVLLCSPAAIKRIKGYIARIPQAYIIPANIGWMEKRIAHFLNVPMMSPNPSIVETITSRSYSKRLLSAASVNIPVGAHDIFSLEDLYVATTRLIACNLHVRKWVFRLNFDLNNDSAVVLDTNKMPLIGMLRAEQKLLFENTNNQTGSWYTKNVQLSVRKRLLEVLSADMAGKVTICRKDLYPSWDHYLRHMCRVGLVVEAEPIEKLGYVDSMCFIDPLGQVELHGGADVVVDDKYQAQSFIAPQTQTPVAAMEGATRAIAKYLFETLGVIGYVTVKLCAFWDGLDNIPRLWANGLHFGMSPLFGALTTASIAADPYIAVPKSLLPAFPREGKICVEFLFYHIKLTINPFHFPHSFAGKFYVYVPVAIHEQLKGSRDDVFFRLCRMRGISFDPAEHTGTLFFLVDAVVGGAISMLCIANTRFRVLEQAVQCLSFITSQFGKEKGQGRGGVSDCTTLCSILLYLRKAHKKEEARIGFLKT